MPLYEYECTECRRHTEKIQKFSEPEITSCPYCGGALKRVISAPAFSLKGGGWYADGYGSAKPASAAAEAAAKDGPSKEGGTKDAVAKEGGSKPVASESSTAATPAASVAPAPSSAPEASSDKA